MVVQGQQGEHLCRCCSSYSESVFGVRQGGQMVRVMGVGKDVCYSLICEDMTEDPQVGRWDPDALCVSSCPKSFGSKELIVGPAERKKWPPRDDPR